MKKMFVLLCLCIAVISCEKLPEENGVKQINATITDSKGVAIREAADGFQLRISAPEFRELNKQGILLKEGSIQFDKIVAPILQAADDWILTAVPIMNNFEPLPMNIYLNIRQVTFFQLCRACLVYRPRVSGTIIAGMKGGSSDGTFNKPAEMIHDAAGNLYIIDQRSSNHDRIMKMTTEGVVTEFAGAGDVFGRLVGIGINNGAGLLYVSDATSQQVKSINIASPSTITVLAGSGSAGNTDGTGTAASFRFGTQAVDNFGSSECGQGLTVDASGNIYVGENYTGSLSSQVRKITPAGVVTTVTGSRVIPTSSEDESAMPSGVAISATNDLFTTSGSSGFIQGVNKISAAGVFSRLAGQDSYEGIDDGTGTGAQFSFPKAISWYGGTLYVADGTNGALRSVSASGRVITLAGVGHFLTNTYNGSGYLPPVEGSYLAPSVFLIPSPDYYLDAAKAIRMDQLGGVTAVNNGLIYVSDFGYRCIWRITIR